MQNHEIVNIIHGISRHSHNFNEGFTNQIHIEIMSTSNIYEIILSNNFHESYLK